MFAVRQRPLFKPVLRWRAALEACRAGVRNANIVCVGDSTMIGYNVSGSGYTGAYGLSPPFRLASKISGSSIEGWIGTYVSGSGSPIGITDVVDTRIVFTGAGWALSSPNLLTTTGAGDKVSFTPAAAFDTMDVFVVKNSSIATYTVDVDGGAPLATITHNASANFVRQTISCTLGTHTINLTQTVGTIYITGLVPYVAANKQIIVLNYGIGGSKTSDWNVATAYRALGSLERVGADLVIIDLTINDVNAGTAQATNFTNLEAIVKGILGSGADVILINGNVRKTANIVNQEIMRKNCEALADSLGLNYIDLEKAWGGTYTSSTTRGYISDDNVHHTPAGAQNIADLLYPIGMNVI